MAQHLLVAADRFQLSRLRRICERRLCETVEVSSCNFTCVYAGKQLIVNALPNTASI